MFQTDSVLCGASSHSIAEFETLGYIGCLAVSGQLVLSIAQAPEPAWTGKEGSAAMPITVHPLPLNCLQASDGDAGPESHWRRTHPAYAFWGAGGLSFHHRSAALHCLAAFGHLVPPSYPEDLFFSECVMLGYGRPPPNASWVAAFCTQDAFVKRSFGAHRVHDRLLWAGDMFDFLMYCPENVPLLLPESHHTPDASDFFWGAWRQARFPM